MSANEIVCLDMRPRVTAVVLNYNGFDESVKCVDSLENCGYSNLEIVIVDNASPDGSGEALHNHFPNLIYIAEPANLGYSAGNNAGIRYALTHNAEYILIINNDVVVQPGFLDPLVSMLEVDPAIGAVNGKVFYQSMPDEVFSAAGEFSYLHCTGMNKNRNRAIVNSHTLECDVDYVCGVLVLIRRKVFESLGLLDERFFMYFEDVEFSRRVQTKFRLGYTALSVAYHKSGGGKGWTSYTELYLYYHTRNRFFVFQNESMGYKVYVCVYTLMNCIAKGVVISTGLWHDPSKVRRQWKAMIRGYKDGFKTYLDA